MASLASPMHEANAAFVDEDYERALRCYDAAVQGAADAQEKAEAYAFRAAAHLKLGNYTAAADDARQASELCPSAKAYRRRGVACFSLGSWTEAKEAFSAALRMVQTQEPSVSGTGLTERELRRWVRKCDAEMSGFSGKASASLDATATPVLSNPAVAPSASGPSQTAPQPQ
eukprot:6198732-Pleurochrysis_carterae.AAC.1